MSIVLLAVSLVIIMCILSQKFTFKLGIPALIAFMFVGVLFGSDGIVGLNYDNFASAETICSVGLIFIMFDGGFNTNWAVARKYVAKAAVLSTIGVLLTGLIATAILYYVFHLSLTESFLISSVLASTDAASVFSILKANNLDLRNGTSSILEVESGSNDPMAYLLTITAIGIMLNGKPGNIFLTIFLQITLGFLLGLIFAKVSKYFLSRKSLLDDSLDFIFVIAIVLMCYALTDLIGGNAYLSVYILGIRLGNARIASKRIIAVFLDQVTLYVQMLIFFIIGLLSTPSSMPASIPLSLAVFFTIVFVARPLMTMILLLPMKCSLKQCLLIAWAGLKGASSIVFAIVAVSSGISLSFDIFHVVFLVSLISVLLQGTLLPAVCAGLDMIDEQPDIYKTFKDFSDTVDFQFANLHIAPGSKWIGKRIKDLDIPNGLQIIMIHRDGRSLAARGKTVIQVDDDLIVNTYSYYPSRNEYVEEIEIKDDHPWADRTLKELQIPENQLVIMDIRGEEKIIPNGDTTVRKGDVLLVFHGE